MAAVAAVRGGSRGGAVVGGVARFWYKRCCWGCTHTIRGVKIAVVVAVHHTGDVVAHEAGNGVEHALVGILPRTGSVRDQVILLKSQGNLSCKHEKQEKKIKPLGDLRSGADSMRDTCAGAEIPSSNL